MRKTSFYILFLGVFILSFSSKAMDNKEELLNRASTPSSPKVFEKASEALLNHLYGKSLEIKRDDGLINDSKAFKNRRIVHSPKMRSQVFENHSLEGNKKKQAELLIKGQGTVVVKLSEPSLSRFSPLHITIGTASSLNSGHNFLLEISKNFMAFYGMEGEVKKELLKQESSEVGIDLDSNCSYWFSLDSHNKILRYGKGEIRKNTTLAEYSYQPELMTYDWAHELRYISIDGNITNIDVWRDPVVIDPALIVVNTDKMTMDMAANFIATVPANLTQECQKLYANISGDSFVLNTSDFPNFTDAIEKSIQNPLGWCHKKLKEKEGEFGKEEKQMAYLRITMGYNQGNSPGVPYVLTIWPGGHYSPIHNHAEANAIIRVLKGEITMELFPFLSLYHQKPFMSKILYENNITWLAPQLNQTHRLINHNENGPICITMECYLYNADDNAHQEYLDYIDSNGYKICQFDPISDMDFLEFKKLMQDEWRRI
jgi:hypothetical protein